MRKENPDDWKEKRDRGDMMTNPVRYATLYQQEGRCYVCSVEEWKTKRRFDAHRVTPGKNGGKYLGDNVILVCRKCHNKIEGMTLEEINTIRVS